MINKIKIIFFASLRENLGKEQLELSLDKPLTIDDLKNRLVRDEGIGEALLEDGIQCSIDYEFARGSSLVGEDVKEVAFFPPVTGG